MHIIFKKNLPIIDDKYTVLALDTFRLPDGELHTAYCVIENIPIAELPATENLKELHAGLIDGFGQRNWDYCEQAIAQLMGKWGGEVDTFYIDLSRRIETLKTQDLDDNWTPVIQK
jgi:hypothetical protein